MPDLPVRYMISLSMPRAAPEQGGKEDPSWEGRKIFQ
jgi:hypothetical protein